MSHMETHTVNGGLKTIMRPNSTPGVFAQLTRGNIPVIGQLDLSAIATVVVGGIILFFILRLFRG